ncbi:MAG: Qat anti-phage system associated protein QatB [Acidobacteriota bacterium]
MGTSSSYGGPKGTGGLLPPWADDVPPPAPDAAGEGDDAPPAPDKAGEGENVPPADDAPNPQTPSATEWAVPKSNLSKWARGNAGYSDSHGSLRSYVAASGGARGASAAAVSGRATARRLGGFLASVASGGFAEAARSLGITDLVGRSISAVLAELVDRLTPDGALLEESVAREAAAMTLEALFERLGVDARGLAALDRVDLAVMEETLREFVSNYVSERFLQMLGDCIDRGAVSAAQANTLYAEVRDVVTETVKVDFEGKNLTQLDWSGAEAKGLIDGVFTTAYAFIEGL